MFQLRVHPRWPGSSLTLQCYNSSFSRRFCCYSGCVWPGAQGLLQAKIMTAISFQLVICTRASPASLTFRASLDAQRNNDIYFFLLPTSGCVGFGCGISVVAAWGLVPDQGWMEPWPLYWERGVLATGHQGDPWKRL